MKTLSTPIQLKNVTKISVDKFRVDEDSDPPHAVVNVHLEDNDGLPYFTAELTVFDGPVPSGTLALNLSPISASDKVVVVKRSLTGAYTALVSAAGSLHGAAKRSAVETACAASGVFGTGLTF